MSEPINKKRIVIVGVFIVLAILVFLGGILTIGNLHSTFTKKMTISTIFGDVNGLSVGNNIWFSGVKIGTVKKVEFYGKSQVRVEMNISENSQQYIRKDAKVKISTDGFIGNKILVIYGGTNSFPEVEEGDVLSNEPLLSTEDIMNTFQENNLNIKALTEKLKNGEGTVGKLLNNDSLYNSIVITANSLQLASAKARVAIASLTNFSNDLSNFSAKLNTKGSLANDLVTDKVVFNSFRTSALELEHTMTDLQHSVNGFTTSFNKEGTLINRLITDTVIYNSMQASVFQFQQIADTAAALVRNLKEISNDPNSPVGVLLHDSIAGNELKITLKNLESSSEKLDQDLEALQHNFLLRGYFRKQAKKKGLIFQ